MAYYIIYIHDLYRRGSMKILIINGPNLNMLGIREKEIYGSMTYDEMIDKIKNDNKDIELEFFQSNAEGEIIDKLHEAFHKKFDGIVLNPGAYTHYSYAIHDAVLSIMPIPVIEVHLSNINSREEFRRNSVIAPACIGQISGLGYMGYNLAISYIKRG